MHPTFNMLALSIHKKHKYYGSVLILKVTLFPSLGSTTIKFETIYFFTSYIYILYIYIKCNIRICICLCINIPMLYFSKLI